MTAIADHPMVWQCECGKRPWMHAEHCSCGRERPVHVEAKPADLAPLTGASEADATAGGFLVLLEPGIEWQPIEITAVNAPFVSVMSFTPTALGRCDDGPHPVIACAAFPNCGCTVDELL